MQHRSMSLGVKSPSSNSFWGSSNSSNAAFAAYGKDGGKPANPDGGESQDSQSIFGQLWGIQDSMITQLQGMGQSLPEPLSEGFRQRLAHAVYLLLAAAFFGALTVLIGLPTLLVRPSKFVLCLTLTTGCAAGSAIVIQKPAVFFSKLVSGAWSESLPFLLLVATEMLTVYVTIFIHKYIAILVCAGVQMVALLYYLSCFIPGGTAGVTLVLRMMWTLASTLLRPILSVMWQCLRTVWS